MDSAVQPAGGGGRHSQGILATSIEKDRDSRLLKQIGSSKIRAGEDQMVGKRHASAEISAKLARAFELAGKGKTQREISKALGLSIMTYHRWKKLINAAGNSSQHGARSETPGTQLTNANDASVTDTIQRLELENSQLRRLVTDMLLDKLKLENELRARQEAQIRRPGKR